MSEEPLRNFTEFSNKILNGANGPKLYYLEINKKVAAIRVKYDDNPLAVEFAKNEQESKQLLDIQDKFKDRGFHVEVKIPNVVENKSTIPKVLFKSFTEFSSAILADPNGPQLYYFQANELAAIIRNKKDGYPLAIEVAMNEIELEYLKTIMKKFVRKGYDVGITNFKSVKDEVKCQEENVVNEPEINFDSKLEEILNDRNGPEKYYLKVFGCAVSVKNKLTDDLVDIEVLKPNELDGVLEKFEKNGFDVRRVGTKRSEKPEEPEGSKKSAAGSQSRCQIQ